jgi:hypothetical protein
LTWDAPLTMPSQSKLHVNQRARDQKAQPFSREIPFFSIMLTEKKGHLAFL